MNRVSIKILLSTGLVALLATGVTAYLLLAAETRARLDTLERDLRLGGDLLLSASVAGRGERQGHDWARLTLREAQALPPELRALRVFTPEGRILASRDPAELGQQVDAATLATFQRRSQQPGGGGVFAGFDGATFPEQHEHLRVLRSRERCAGACHPGAEVALGGLQLVLDTAPLHREISSFRSKALVSWIALLLGLLLLTALLVHGFLGRPLETLRRVVRRAEEGDFLVRAPERSQDEIGQLARAFNQLLRRLTDLKVDVVDTGLERDSAQNLRAQVEERGGALEDAYRILEDRVADLSLIFEVSRVVNSSLDLDRILGVFCERIAQQLQVPRVAVALVDTEAGGLRVHTVQGFPEPERVRSLVFPPGEGIPWLAMERQEPVVVQDTREDSRVSYFLGRVREEGSLAAFPLRHRGQPSGVLILSRPDGRGFVEEETRLLQTISDQLAMAVANARLHEATRTLAITDPLTGLFNRRYLEHRLQLEWKRALRFHHPLSVLMIDVDHFKEYNDAYGHLFGDRALTRLAKVLRASLRGVDMVARYGGEEFAVLLPHTELEAARQVAEKLRQALALETAPSPAEQGAEPLTISIGVASLPDESCSATELLDRADHALLRAKEQGRDRVELDASSPEQG